MLAAFNVSAEQLGKPSGKVKAAIKCVFKYSHKLACEKLLLLKKEVSFFCLHYFYRIPIPNLII